MNATFLLVTKIKNIRMCNVHELFWCFSATVSTIYCFHPKFRLFVVRNWILLYIKKNAKRCAQMSRSSYYRFTFLGLSFGHLVQNKQIVNVLWISTHQTLLRGKTRWFQGLFMVSGSKHLSSTNNHNKSLDFFCSCAGGMEICKSDSTLTSRCQSVVYGSAQSAPQQIKSDVPQGSMLGPILLSIFINDLPNSFT